MCLSCIVSKIFNVKYWHDLEICIKDYSRSLKMAPLDVVYTTSYQSAFAIVALFCTIFETFDVVEYRDLVI